MLIFTSLIKLVPVIIIYNKTQFRIIEKLFKIKDIIYYEDCGREVALEF